MTDAKELCKRFTIHGRVQGVGCRFQIQEWALQIGSLSGYVKNLADGKVEACVFGQSWRVLDFEKALREKLTPPVIVEWVESEDLDQPLWPPGFVIRRS
jgi:acylphosphatase